MTKDEALKLALEKIATVNAMDYEYQAWAREALAQPYADKATLSNDRIKIDSVTGNVSIGLAQPEPVIDKSAAIRIATSLGWTPQRKPLTEKRIEELYSFWVVDCQDIVGFARAVERTVKGEV